jgi:Tol biopolymer transport system component
MRRSSVLLLAPVLLAGCTWITRSSVPNQSGLGPEGNASSTHPSLSQHGGVVAFDSSASNFVGNDLNRASDVFIRDHVANKTKRVSLNDAGTGGNGPSRDPAISDDGRYVAFETDASNLFLGDGDGKTDVVVRDRVAGTTRVVSIQPNGDPFTLDAIDPAISGNGRFVSFNAYVPFMEFCCVLTGPYVRDTTNNTTKLMPQTGGGIASAGSPGPLSDDGTRILYGGFAPLSGGTTGDASYGIAVADTASATIVANVAQGTLSHQYQTYFNLALSGDGHLVAVLFGSTSGGPLFTYDLNAPGLHQVFPNFAQTRQVALSDDGGVIAFGATISGPPGWYVTDPAGSPPKRVSANGSGTPASSVDRADLSGDGTWVAFATNDPAMVSGDGNGVTDVFTRSVGDSQGGPTAP